MFLVHAGAFIILLVLQACAGSELYLNITEANTYESLIRIKSVSLKHYEFIYDSVKERRLFGILGDDAERWFPESVTIISKKIISGNNDNKALHSVSFPHVDNNIIFMHGLAALQELLRLTDNLNASIQSRKHEESEQNILFENIEKRLTTDSEVQALERKRLLQAQLEHASRVAELERLRAEEEQKMINAQLAEDKLLLEYENEMIKKRFAHDEKLAEENMLRTINLEKELAETRERLRRDTKNLLKTKQLENNQHLSMKKIELSKEKIVAEISAKSLQERTNQDIALRKIELQSRLDAERRIEFIKISFKYFYELIKRSVSRPSELAIICGSIIFLFAFYYFLKEVIGLLRYFIQSKLGRPALIRETSFEWRIVSVIKSIGSLCFRESLKQGLQHIEKYFEGVILSENDRERVIQIALSTRHTRRTGSPYRHILLEGPPGTGKTLIARKLAQSSGMDYAIMSGGDVGPLGDDAVSQLHSLFRWASTSRKGLLVFIDEAEAFLSARSNSNSAIDGGSPNLRHALNALLYQTGTQSKCFMLVLATNRPEDLDAAILDRMDVSLHIGLPEIPQRLDLIKLYMNLHVINFASKSQHWNLFRNSNKCTVDPRCLDDSYIRDIANQLDGFSGREIAKLFIASQYAMLLAPNQILLPSILETTIQSKIQQHSQRLKYETLRYGKVELKIKNDRTQDEIPPMIEDDNSSISSRKASTRKRSSIK